MGVEVPDVGDAKLQQAYCLDVLEGRVVDVRVQCKNIAKKEAHILIVK